VDGFPALEKFRVEGINCGVKYERPDADTSGRRTERRQPMGRPPPIGEYLKKMRDEQH